MFGLILNRSRLLADRALLGQWGEKRCEKFLRRKGLKTLTRNFSCKTGEIDLIMVDLDGTVVFVEVKTRANEDFVSAESAITKHKKIKFSRAAKYFIAVNDIKDRPLRFDVVTIIPGQQGKAKIRHYENAFTL